MNHWQLVDQIMAKTATLFTRHRNWVLTKEGEHTDSKASKTSPKWELTVCKDSEGNFVGLQAYQVSDLVVFQPFVFYRLWFLARDSIML